ncbi:furcatin hydrolase-like [Coffea arabica]|uniref:Furcatin hydrolase-like n=1 Tax=Coffea arabica TaxID=13443 RepID=A0A6P6VH36_COFAR|nr:furcatin hydrolase-like [Coffea arabica]
MALQGSIIVSLLILANFLSVNVLSSGSTAPSNITNALKRSSFPPRFIFGAASSAYQYEGAAFEDGKGPSIWDTYTHKYPEKILDRSNGDLADNFYHRYKEDVRLMKFIGLNGFRFSISWARVIPHGKLSKGVNKAGIAFYNNLINDLLSKGIQPFVTLFHWDVPQVLEDEYGGFLSPHIVKDFRDFAELCFKEFGDRVKHWSTFNEPWSFATGGYDSSTIIGTLAPGRCSAWMNKGCPAGNSAVEPYLVGHHILLSHAVVVKLYRDKYKASHKGQIGIVLVTNWMMPFSNLSADVNAAQRTLDFFYGWFLDPLTYGDYPKIMRSIIGARLPKFSHQQKLLLKGSIDFLGVNYYTSSYVSNIHAANSVNISYSTDLSVNLTSERNGKLIGAPTGVSIFYDYPEGLTDLLVYTKKKYNNPVIYITENGIGDANIHTVKEGVNDPQRIRFYRGHLSAVKAAIKAGVRVKGFFAWTFIDTFEWGSGYTLRFGINFVDFKNGLKRYPKRSALWLKGFLK